MPFQCKLNTKISAGVSKGLFTRTVVLCRIASVTSMGHTTATNEKNKSHPIFSATFGLTRQHNDHEMGT
jgi:hypothetical protein